MTDTYTMDITIQEIIEGCRLGGISLPQRLDCIEYSTIPALQIEAELIKAELLRRRQASNHPANIDRAISKTYSDEYRAWLHSGKATPGPHPWKVAA